MKVFTDFLGKQNCLPLRLYKLLFPQKFKSRFFSQCYILTFQHLLDKISCCFSLHFLFQAILNICLSLVTWVSLLNSYSLSGLGQKVVSEADQSPGIRGIFIFSLLISVSSSHCLLASNTVFDSELCLINSC